MTSRDAVDDRFESSINQSITRQAQAQSLKERAERDRAEGLSRGLNLTGEARDKR